MKIFFFLLLLPLGLHARLAVKSETIMAVNDLQIKVMVKADGTYSTETTIDYEILNAKESNFSTFPIYYLPAISKVTWLEGHVINGDKKTPILKSDFTQESYKSIGGIDASSTMNFKIPPTEDGSKVHIKYKVEHSKVFIHGQFSFNLDLINYDFVEKGFVQIDSELPLHYLVNDPFSSFKIAQKNSSPYEVKVTFVKPIAHLLKDEPNNFLPATKSTAISIGTHTNWNIVKRNYRSLFDVVLNSTMPQAMEKAVTEARKKNSLVDQLNVIHSHLRAHFSYEGDMKTSDARPALRMPSTLYRLKVADDKELSAMMVMMLRKLGFKADVVLVTNKSRSSFVGLPSSNYFNHVIVKADIEGEDYWIDPTNVPFYGPNHKFKLSGMPALGLNDSSELEDIPFSNPIEARAVSSIKLSYRAELQAYVKSKIQYSGVASYRILRIAATKGKDAAHELIKKLLLFSPSSNDFEIYRYVLSDSYIPLTIEGRYESKGMIGSDKQGKYFVGPSVRPYYAPLLETDPNNVGDLFLDEPIEYFNTGIFYKVLLDPQTNIKCQLTSPWLDVDIKALPQKNGFTLTELLRFKKSFVTNAELRSAEFQSFVQKLKNCHSNSKVYLKL